MVATWVTKAMAWQGTRAYERVVRARESVCLCVVLEQATVARVVCVIN